MTTTVRSDCAKLARFHFHNEPSDASGHLYRVEAWKGYGVVCPSLLTTNGNAAAFILSLPWKELNTICWCSEHPDVPSELSSPLALWDALVGV